MQDIFQQTFKKFHTVLTVGSSQGEKGPGAAIVLTLLLLKVQPRFQRGIQHVQI